MESLGNRIKKNYELPATYRLTRRIPVIIRLDGQAFHTLGREMTQPFDDAFHGNMTISAMDSAINMQGFKLAYVQSDEVSFLLTDYSTLETAAWFDYTKSKLESITASRMTAYFNARADYSRFGCFDARAFAIPREEVVNYFLWRAKDWERNSLHMYCRSIFPHGAMHRKPAHEQHEMLHAVGKNWAKDLTDWQKNGTFITKEFNMIDGVTPSYRVLADMIDPLIDGAAEATILGYTHE